MRFFILITLLFLLYPSLSFAEDIKTGDAYVNTSISTNANDGSITSNVQTNIQSSGNSDVSVVNEVKSESSNTSTKTNSTYKKIEVTVNGEKKIVESTSPGETKIEINTKIITPKPSSTLIPKSTSPTKLPTISPTPKFQSNKVEEHIDSWLKNFISNIFKIFRK